MKTKLPAVRLTNKLNLPRPIVEAMTNDPYDAADSDYTATSLLQPARMRRLQQMFPDDCVEDVSDRMYSLIGQSLHVILERAANALSEEGFVVEKRFSKMVPVDGDLYKVSAQVDLYDPATATLSDYKTTSVSALSYGVKEEHKYQLNLQALLVRAAGFPVEKLQIVGIFRDWSATRAEAQDSYPQEPAVVQDVPLMTDEEILTWVTSRVRAHQQAKQATTQAQLPLCTDEETWTRTDGDVFAVLKPGAARALKLMPTKHEAEAYVKERSDASLIIEERLGKSVRCNNYCPASKVCVQWKISARNPANKPKRDRDGRGKVSLPYGFDDLE